MRVTHAPTHVPTACAPWLRENSPGGEDSAPKKKGEEKVSPGKRKEAKLKNKKKIKTNKSTAVSGK